MIMTGPRSLRVTDAFFGTVIVAPGEKVTSPPTTVVSFGGRRRKVSCFGAERRRPLIELSLAAWRPCGARSRGSVERLPR